jgi:Domain of unknown function (DUF4382)
MRCASSIVLSVALAALGCGSNATSSPTSPSTASATLNIVLKDSPFTDAKALLVTFSEVSAHLTGGSFFTLPFVSNASRRTCDLKKLQSAQDVLGTGPLQTGHYTEVRLVVASAMIYFDTASTGSPCASTIAAPAGRYAVVDVASGDLRLNREFDVTSTAATTILLDFDGDQSVKQTGNGSYTMTPVITVLSVQ